MRWLMIILLYHFILPTSASAGTLKDDFSDGNLDGWRLHKFGGQSAKWLVKDGKLICIDKEVCAPVASTLIIGDNTWSNYEFELQLKIEQTFDINNCKPEIGIAIHSDDTNFDTGIYFYFHRNGVWSSSSAVIAKAQQQVTVKPPIERFILEEGKWYTARAVANGNSYKMYIVDEQIHNFKSDLPDNGRAGIFARNCEAYFDNIIIIGDDIPEMNLSVQSKSKITTTWGRVRLGKLHTD